MLIAIFDVKNDGAGQEFSIEFRVPVDPQISTETLTKFFWDLEQGYNARGDKRVHLDLKETKTFPLTKPE